MARRVDDWTGKQTDTRNLRKVTSKGSGEQYEVHKKHVGDFNAQQKEFEAERTGSPPPKKKGKWKRRIVGGSGGH